MASSGKISELLNPELLNSLSGLNLISRVLSEELLAGANVSRKTGVGMEFSQYRSYEPGDDMRLLDWKLYARTERYFVRQAVIYSNIHVRFILDNTASMNYKESGISKLNFASVIIATLTYLAWRSGDNFSFTNVKGDSTGMSNDQRHLNRILYLLLNESGKGKFPIEETINQWGKTLQKEFVIMITDLYQEEKELSEFLKKLKISQNEVIVFHITGEQEEKFEFNKPVFFQDLETNEKVKTDPGSIKEEYLRNRDRYFTELYHELSESGIIIEKISMADDLRKVLKRFLTERNYLHL